MNNSINFLLKLSVLLCLFNSASFSQQELPWICVTDPQFGVQVNSETNQETNIQKAIDTCHKYNKPLFFPNGVYHVQKPLILKCSMFGSTTPFAASGTDNKSASIIAMSGFIGNTMLDFSGQGEGYQISNLCFDASGIVDLHHFMATNNGLGCAKSSIKNVRFINSYANTYSIFSHSVAAVQGAFTGSYWENCWWDGCGALIYLGVNQDDILMSSCRFTSQPAAEQSNPPLRFGGVNICLRSSYIRSEYPDKCRYDCIIQKDFNSLVLENIFVEGDQINAKWFVNCPNGQGIVTIKDLTLNVSNTTYNSSDNGLVSYKSGSGGYGNVTIDKVVVPMGSRGRGWKNLVSYLLPGGDNKNRLDVFINGCDMFDPSEFSLRPSLSSHVSYDNLLVGIKGIHLGQFIDYRGSCPSSIVAGQSLAWVKCLNNEYDATTETAAFYLGGNKISAENNITTGIRKLNFGGITIYTGAGYPTDFTLNQKAGSLFLNKSSGMSQHLWVAGNNDAWKLVK